MPQTILFMLLDLPEVWSDFNFFRLLNSNGL